MNATRMFRYAAATILLIDGLIHLALAAVASSEVLVLATFGVLYVVVAAGLFWGKRAFAFTYLGIILPIIGIFLGTYSYTINPQAIVLVIIGMDTVVILFLLLVASKKLD
jgi:hypothetical protein